MMPGDPNNPQDPLGMMQQPQGMGMGMGLEGEGAPGLPVGVGDEDLLQATAEREAMGEGDTWSLPSIGPIQHPGWGESVEFRDLQDQYTRAEAFWASDRKKLRVLYQDYVSWHDKNTYAYRSNLFIPKIYTAIRQVVARETDTVLSVPHLAVIEPLAIGPTQPQMLTVEEHRALMCTSLMKMLLDLGAFPRTYCTQLALDAAIFGRAIAKLGWHRETVAEGGSERVKAEYPAVLRVSPFRFLIDPVTDSVESARFVFEDLVMAKEMVQRYVRSGIFDEQVASELDYGPSPGKDSDERQLARASRNEGTYDGGDSGYAVVVEAWAYLDPDQNGNASLHRVFWDKQSLKCLGVQESPFKHGRIPYCVGVPFPVPESPYGLGVAEVLHYLQKEYNLFRAMAVENSLAAANVFFLLNRVAGIDEDALCMSRPNRIVKGNFITDDHFRQFQAKSNLPEIAAHLGYLDGDIQAAGGVTPITLAQKAANTAFATQTLQQNAQVNFDIFDSMLCMTMLQPALEQLWSNTQQFLSNPVLMRVAAGDPVVVDKQMIQGDFRVTAGNTRAAGRRFQMAQALTTTLAMGAQAGVMGDYGRALQRVLDWYGVENPESYFPSMLTVPGQQQALMPGGGEGALPQEVGGVRGQPSSNEVGEQGGMESFMGQGSGRVGPGGEMPAALSGIMGGMG